MYNDGELVGFNYNGNNYYYGIDNLGVIHYIYNESGEIVVTYTYDAWGNTISVTGNSTLISVNLKDGVLTMDIPAKKIVTVELV